MGAIFSQLSESSAELLEPVNGLNPAGKTLNDCLRYHADNKPDGDAFVFVSANLSRECVTWKSLYDRARKMADYLISSGMGREDFVIISMRTCPEWLYIFFGAMLAGMRAVSQAFTYQDGSDVISLMNKLNTGSILFLDPGLGDNNWKIVSSLVQKVNDDGTVHSSNLTGLKRVVLRHHPVDRPEMTTFKQIMTSDFHEQVLPEVNENDVTYLFQTSGSTGVPKLAVHTHKTAVAYIRCIHSEMFAFDDVMFNDRPFTWIGGFPFNVVTGQTRVTTSSDYSSMEQRLSFFVDIVKRERCTSALVLPPLIIPLMKMKDQYDSSWPLRTVFTGGMPITSIFVQCVGVMCKHLIITYASTETGMLAVCTLNDTSQFTDFSCGTQISLGSIKVANDQGQPLSINQRGEIYTKLESQSTGYYNDDERTAKSFYDGWYKTDDMGRMNESGNLIVEGRKSDMILTGGFTVAPSVLEMAIKRCPGVEQVAVVGIPDEIMYQVICACVIVKPGSGLTESDLKSFCEGLHNEKTETFDVLPKYFIIMEKFPETYTGKISKKELTEIVTKRLK